METWKARVRRAARAYFWSILIWVGFSPVLAGQDEMRLLERGQYANYWNLLLANGAWLLTAALLTPPIFYIVHRFPVVKQNRLWRLGAYLLGSIPYVTASVFIRWIVLPPWNAAGQTFAPRSAHGLIGNVYLFGNQIWDYIVILVAAHAYAYFRRAQNQELERAELQQALAASELQSLKSQLHPHFLFNTLHGISALVNSDPGRAKSMILKLSGLLRTALGYGNTDLITLDEELKFIEGYLDLERMRLEDRLQVRCDVHPETQRMLVPQLILQPLVENAIVHGVACSRDGGWIRISSSRTGDLLEITITNSVGGRSSKGMGLGLQNTRGRLKHLYADEGKFLFHIDPGKVAIATLSFPGFPLHEAEATLPGVSEKEVAKDYASIDRG
jgi:two-component system, LytTR family, sensor kinase